MALTTIDSNAVDGLAAALDAKADKAGGTITGIVKLEGTNPRLDLHDTDSASGAQFASLNLAGGVLATQKRDDAGTFVTNLEQLDMATGNRTMNGDLLPGNDATRSLGSSTMRWSGNFSNIMLTGTAGTVRSFKLASAGLARFKIGLGSGPESGGNTGSTFVVWRCDDAGNDIAAGMVIDRPTGEVNFPNHVTVGNTSTGVVVGATGVLELTAVSPFIDLKNNGNDDYDARIVLQSDGAALRFEGVPARFAQRPTWNGVGLATVDEAAAGGGGAGVTSFSGRTGAVTPQAGDYNTSHISYSGQTQSYWNDLFLKSRMRTPAEFGILPGNTAADNTTNWNAMQAALPNGAVVIWPQGDFSFSGTIVQTAPFYHIGVPNKNKDGAGTRWMFGASDQLNTFKQKGGAFQGITFYKTAQGAYLLVAPDGTTAPTGSSGSYSYQSGTAYVDFDNCQFYGPCTTALVYLTNVLKWTFRYTKFHNTHTSSQTRCVWLNGGNYDSTKTTTAPTGGDNVDNVEFANCLFTGEANATRVDGVQLDGKADSTKFFQCVAVWLYYGIWLTKTGPTTQVPNFTRWTQGGFENNYKNAIFLQYGDIATFSDMYASLDNSTASDTQYGSTDVVLVDSTYIGTAEFTACQMRGGKRSAYRLEGGRTTITGGQAGNSAIRATGYSVDALSTINSLIMSGVDCRTLATGSTGQTWAVRNLKGATNVIINGCNLSGYSSGAFQSGGTGTGITGNLT